MKRILLFIFTFFLISNSYSQSNLELIRASSYYSNAVINYSEGNYKNALSNLQLAEENLKGKTNRDLEYLKIMSNYGLKKYKEAYNQVKVYFEEGFSERKKSFRNVTLYSKANNIDYEEELTAIFVSLEKNSNSKIDTNSENLIDVIVAKIKKNKVSFSNYSNKALLPKVTEKIDYCLREVSNGTLKRVYENNFLNLKMNTTNKKYSFYFTGNISGKAINTSNYKFEVTFTPTKTEVTKNHYSYGYKQNKVKHIEGNVKLKETVYQCYSLTAPKQESSHFSNLLIDKFKSKNFVKKGLKTKVYKIVFTEKEKNFLSQGNNLTVLNNTLRSKGLL